jgi:imidazolonepropionase-like amidohydrolase
VVDVARGRSTPKSTILVRGNRIASVTTDALPSLNAARVIDAAGGVVIPGLWDAHGHLFDEAHTDNRARAAIAAGVTSIRDLLSDTTFVPLQNSRIEAGDEIGPRVFGAGFIDGWYPDSLLFGRFPTRVGQPVQARDTADVKRLVDRYAELGFTWIKIYDALPRHLVSFAIAEAHRRGMRVTGHVPIGMTTHDAIDAGFDELAHAGEVIGSLVNPETRDPIIAGLNGERAAALDVSSPRTRDLIDRLRARRVAVGPTLCVYEGRLRKSGASPASRKAYANYLSFVRLLRESGVRITAGADNSCSIARELELLREAGFTDAELLRIATLDAARDVQREQDLGSVESGKLADLVILSRNPLVDITALREVRIVIKDGLVFDDIARIRKP